MAEETMHRPIPNKVTGLWDLGCWTWRDRDRAGWGQRASGFCCTLLCVFALFAPAWAAGQEPQVPAPDIVRLADGKLQLGLSTATGSLCELAELPGGSSQLGSGPAAGGLWQLALRNGATSQVLAADSAGPPAIERLSGEPPGLRLLWHNIASGAGEPLRVEIQVRLSHQDAALSCWEFSLTKPKGVRIAEVRFPRVFGLRQRPQEILAVPKQLGVLVRQPRRLMEGKQGKGHRLCWRYPYGTELSLQCLAWYEEGGSGFYAACDDAVGYRKDFSLWGDGEARVHFEIIHEPEQQAAEMSQFRLPFTVVLGAFRGDWTTAAQLYRESPSAKRIAERGRLRRRLVPDWLPRTGLWLWNRGRSPQVLQPAVVLRKHLEAPVSILWHWWHSCPYDAGFPEYLPPREGADAFKAALAAAQRQDIHAILYMNQRLWGMQTRSWDQEAAEAWAVKDADGKVRPEVYNVYTKAPCAPMCIGTPFWRDKYAGLAQEALCDLKADGVYMDQAGVWANCYDPAHGHILGPGRYWTDGLALLTGAIRDRVSPRGPVALGGEFCGEPWIGNLDLTLALSVSHDRIGAGPLGEPIPFFQAVYHSSTVVFGNMAGLVHPPYDERWPQELAPPGRLSLLDRKFARQFYLEHARTFAWGMQPMLANFLPSQLEERPEEMDFVTRLVRTRLRSLKYLLEGTWLRPPALDVPHEEIDVAVIGTYTPLKASKRIYPVALAGAWRAPDGNVAIALASIHDARLPLRLPIDARAYGLPATCAVYRIDETGRHRIGSFDASQQQFPFELPPRGLCLLEFCRNEKE